MAPQPLSRINKQMKDDIFDTFDKMKWGYNRQLGKAGTLETEIQALIDKHSPTLTKKKVAYQLKLWKQKTYKHADASIQGTPEEIRFHLEAQFALSPSEFARTILSGMIPGTADCEERSADEKELLLRYASFVQEGAQQLEAILNDPALLKVFVDVADNYTTIGCECFPRVACMTSLADTKFQTMRMSSMRQKFIPQFAQQARQDPLLRNLSDTAIRTVALSIEDCMFRFWAIMGHEQNERPVEIATEVRINTQSLPVVYYTASWILGGLFEAKKAAAKDKDAFVRVAVNNAITKDESWRQGLPTIVLDRRDGHGNKHRASRPFFDFICKLECTYVQNLTVDMMLSHSRGDLLSKIRLALYQDNTVRAEFVDLMPEDDPDLSDINMLLSYVLVKFVHMRGRWFERAVHGCGKQKNNVVESMPTRSKVVVDSMIASAKSKAKKEEDAISSTIIGADDPQAGSTEQTNASGDNSLDQMYLAAQSNLLAAVDNGDEDDRSIDLVDVGSRRSKASTGMNLDDD